MSKGAQAMIDSPVDSENDLHAYKFVVTCD